MSPTLAQWLTDLRLSCVRGNSDWRTLFVALLSPMSVRRHFPFDARLAGPMAMSNHTRRDLRAFSFDDS